MPADRPSAQQLEISGAWVLTPKVFEDSRGSFVEAYHGDRLGEVLGFRPDVAQANLSVSAAGALRGVHFSAVPPGQARYVMCARGAILDVVVDVRVGSPTYGRSASVLLDDDDKRMVYLGEGLGHAFMALEDHTTVVYLCSTAYAPEREHAISPLDPALGIDWSRTDRLGRPLQQLLSPKDANAPTLAEANAAGDLPSYSSVNDVAAARTPNPYANVRQGNEEIDR